MTDLAEIVAMALAGLIAIAVFLGWKYWRKLQ